MDVYEVIVTGDPSDSEREALTASLDAMVSDFGLGVGRGLSVRTGAGIAGRDAKSATAVAYFGSPSQADADVVEALLESRVPVIPIVTPDGAAEDSLPASLRAVNALRRRGMADLPAAAAHLLLECLGLLRTQRRAFVSYRRTEARAAATQLHDLLGARGFDVFLDTHDIKPGTVFPDAIWQRLCDSDVLLMLDTPTYFENRWTRQELARARAKEIHVLRVVWPEHAPNNQTDVAETIFLDRGELSGGDGPIVDGVAEDIVVATESLRSRSLASRQRSMAGRLAVEVEKIGGSVGPTGAHHAMPLDLPGGAKVLAYPMVGVPTAELLNDVADRAGARDGYGVPVLVYDDVGLRDRWVAHLRWLDDNIASVKAVPVARAGWILSAWEVEG